MVQKFIEASIFGQVHPHTVSSSLLTTHSSFLSMFSNVTRSERKASATPTSPRSAMQLSEFSVEGLFGKYSHKVAFPTSSEEISSPSITIIHGANGIGKTTVLKMLTAMMNFRFLVLKEIPFKESTLRFDNRRKLHVKRSSDKFEISFAGESIVYPIADTPPSEDEKSRYASLRKKFVSATAGITLTFLPADRLRFLGPDPDFGPFSPDDERNRRYPTSYIAEMRERDRERATEFLSRQVRSFIREALFDSRQFFGSGEPDLFGRVIQNLRDIHDTIPSREEVAHELSQVSDLDKLHKRLGLPIDQWDYKQLTTALYDERGKKSNEHVLVAINTYVEFLSSRANARQLIAERLVTFEEVMCSFLEDKNVTVNAKTGILIKDSVTGVHLNESQLSSGEYQLLFLMVSALTTRRRGTVIAIDEPELSMHISWQRRLVSNLLRCASRAAPQLIIATHSPDILGDYQENMTELTSKGA
ncbi:AAA family ATPase [Streptosporangium sp. CA-115845]|uniref:ATP-binding protein n=1 Tax=Streptosporangium sp. CA-115845 TaxID=3240071 RepID=UPI003D92240A